MQSTPFCVLIHPGSMLHAMFSGRFDTKPDEDGTYFIDRDGTHFRYILNYLRTGELVVPDDKTIRHELLIEAKFYQVEGMIKALTQKPVRKNRLRGVWDPLSRPSQKFGGVVKELPNPSQRQCWNVISSFSWWLGCLQLSLLLWQQRTHSYSDKERKLHIWRIFWSTLGW